MKHHSEIQVRFADTDALGHINNVSYAAYAEYARVAFFQDLDTEVTNLILANLELDFRKQVAFGEVVSVETWIGRVGNSSVTMLQHIKANDEVAAEVSSVVVQFDYEAQKAKPVSAELREVLERYLA